MDNRKDNASWKLILLLLLFISGNAAAQFTLRVELLTVPASHPNDPVFIAGNFNGWDPGNAGFLLSPSGDKLVKEIRDLNSGIYEFKFTRGSWNKVETMANGNDVENKLVKLSSDTVIRYNVAGWRDDFTPMPKQHSASAQVKIMDTAFYMPQFGTKRRIWIYLPAGYAASARRYPVLYMHDGQNIFDDYTSGYGEWGVDECLDTLIAANKPPCIVVGVDNGPQRMNEYNPFDLEKYGRGRGDDYINFLVYTLKPFIDEHYRTLKNKENTIIAGSSMGGLISYYGMLKYPEIFGKAGIFSPAFWTAPQINAFTDSLGPKMNGKLFFYIGELEGDKYVDDMKGITEKLGERSGAMIYSVIDPDGRHNEMAWRKWFDEFYIWIMADGYNNVIKLGE